MSDRTRTWLFNNSVIGLSYGLIATGIFSLDVSFGTKWSFWLIATGFTILIAVCTSKICLLLIDDSDDDGNFDTDYIKDATKRTDTGV